MKGIDPLNVEAGDVITEAWDEDGDSSSCHCAFRVEVKKGDTTPPDGTAGKRVIAHDLKAGDVIRKVASRDDEGGCHCDRYFIVIRTL